jgi:hypothetical protein
MDALPPAPIVEQHEVTEAGESPVYYRAPPPLRVGVLHVAWGVADRLSSSSLDAKGVFTFDASLGGRFEIGRATWRPTLGIDVGYRFIGSDGSFFAPGALAGVDLVRGIDTTFGLFLRGGFLYGTYGGVSASGFQIAAIAELQSPSGAIALALTVDAVSTPTDAFPTIAASFAWNFYVPWRTR